MAPLTDCLTGLRCENKCTLAQGTQIGLGSDSALAGSLVDSAGNAPAAILPKSKHKMRQKSGFRRARRRRKFRYEKDPHVILEASLPSTSFHSLSKETPAREKKTSRKLGWRLKIALFVFVFRSVAFYLFFFLSSPPFCWRDPGTRPNKARTGVR